MARDLWILTTAPGSRTQEVIDLFESFGYLEVNRVVVTNNPNPILPEDIPNSTVLLYPGEEFNISKWWDYGLDFISGNYDEAQFDVLLIESDARMYPWDVTTLSHVMRDNDCVMAGADWQNCLEHGEVKVRRDNSAWIAPGKEAWQSRLPGMALMLAGEVGLNHAPTYPRFWYSDDHLEWKARESGGTVLVGGTTIQHTGTQGPLTGDLALYAKEDSKTFSSHWGGHPSIGGVVDA